MSSEAPRQCELCEELVPPNATFCPICGTQSATEKVEEEPVPASAVSPPPEEATVEEVEEEPREEREAAAAEPAEEEASEEEDGLAEGSVTEPEASDDDGIAQTEPAGSSGLVLDWEESFMRLVEKAAEMEGLATEAFVRDAVEDEVKKLLAPPKTLLDLDSAAHALGAPRSDVVKRISEGRLKAKKIDGKWMVQIDGGVGALKKREDPNKVIMRELEAIVRDAGLNGVETDGDVPDSISTTWCFVNQERILVSPTAAWRRFGRNRVIAEAKDAVRRYKRRD